MRIRNAVRIGLMVGLGTSIALSACSPAYIVDRAVGRTVDSAVDRAANRVGQRMGDAIAGHLLGSLTPELMRAYSLGLFQMIFYHGGYNFEFAQYEPGDYTRWEAKGIEHGQWFEKALLRREENGAEWWRVESRAKSDDGQEQRLVIEALFGEPDESGVRTIRRMRAQYPGESEAREVPVREGDAWVIRTDHTLTPESLDGLRVGRESVETPAGTFQTEHLRSSQATHGAINWWVVNADVPGRMVRYNHEQVEVDDDGNATDRSEIVYEVTLMAFGKGATDSRLGAF